MSTAPIERDDVTLECRIAKLEHVEAIRRLQHAYGYFIDRWLYEDALACFAGDGEFHFMNGIFRGRDHGLRRLYGEAFRDMWGAQHPPVQGALVDHAVSQDVVTIGEDGKTARGRFRFVEFVGIHRSNKSVRIGPPDQPWDKPDVGRQWLGGALYENDYLHEDGVWKIARQTYNVVWNVPFEKGWAHAETVLPRFDRLYPEDPMGPDAFRAAAPCWPDTTIVPFHFTHPVTGKPVVTA